VTDTPTETVLITGASSGIGLELAKLFAADGSRLILLARREQRLRDLADQLTSDHAIDAHVLAADLADPDAPKHVAEQLIARNLSVDVLVNNAGFGLRGPFLDRDLSQLIDMIRVNVTALTELTGLLLPAMVERRRGGVLNVGSAAGFQPGPRMAVYFATKAYVLSFSDALFEELRTTGVTVTNLAPGPTATEFGDVAYQPGAKTLRLAVASAASVARAGHRAFRRGKPLVVPGLTNKLITFAPRLLPRWLVRRIVNSIQ